MPLKGEEESIPLEWALMGLVPVDGFEPPTHALRMANPDSAYLIDFLRNVVLRTSKATRRNCAELADSTSHCGVVSEDFMARNAPDSCAMNS